MKPATDYPDRNSDGIPDAFQNRLSITEILNIDAAGETVIVEIEKEPRAPKEGELFISGGEFCRAEFDYGGVRDNLFTTQIIRRILAGSIEIQK